MAVIETKAKEILIAAWGSTDTTYPTTGKALDHVIADTLSVNQDDAEEQTFTFETTDTPETDYTAGAYKVDLNNACLSAEYMQEIMGWVKAKMATSGGKEVDVLAAPETYETRYIALQVKMADNKYYFLPKIAIAPKLVMESIKTNLVYGTLSGTCGNADTSDGKKTPIVKSTVPILVKDTTNGTFDKEFAVE